MQALNVNLELLNFQSGARGKSLEESFGKGAKISEKWFGWTS